MNVNDAFPSKWLRAADLRGNEYRVTISSVEQEDVSGQGDFKPIVYFEHSKKGLALNKTNAMTIASYYGPETSAWAGKQIILYPIKVDFKGQIVDAIRVRALAPKSEEGKLKRPAPKDDLPAGPPPDFGEEEPGADEDDDVPF